MVEPCLMASQRCPPGLGLVFPPEQSSFRASEGFHYCLPCHGLNSDPVYPISCNSSFQQKEERRLLDSNLRIGLNPRKPVLIDFQDSHPDSVRLSMGIAERCALHEKIMKLLASGSIEEQDILDLSKLYHLMGPQSVIVDFPLQDLIYPSNELYFYEPCLGLAGDRNSCCSEKACHPDVQLQYNTGAMLSDIASVSPEFFPSKNMNKSSLTMLVPYFERRRKPRAKIDASKPATETVGFTKSHDKVREKAPSKKKTSTRTGKERVIHGSSYLHACESLLSVIVGRNQEGKSVILSLKKSGSQLPQFLTQCSATIAGTGIAVVLSVLCRVACGTLHLSASKLLSTGLGLGFIWLSWAVNKLRDTVVSISKTSSKLGEREEELMNHLDRNFKDIYFRAATLLVLGVLSVA